MSRIDIKLPDAIQQQLSMPSCVDISLPKAKVPQIRLPTGGSIKGVVDLTKGIPSDCSLNFSLAMQLAPIMASIECLVKLLGIIKPLIEVIKAIPNPVKLAQTVPDFLAAAEALAPCLLVPTPVAMIPFVKDILALLIALLSCLIQQLRSIAKLLGDLEVSIAQAKRDGNADLLATLQCAKENAQASAAGTLQGIEPIKVLLDLAGAFMSIAQVPAIEIPALTPPEDLAALNGTLDTLEGVVRTMKSILDKLP